MFPSCVWLFILRHIFLSVKLIYVCGLILWLFRCFCESLISAAAAAAAVQSGTLRVDGDHLASAAPNHQDAFQAFGEHLEEFHVCDSRALGNERELIMQALY